MNDRLDLLASRYLDDAASPDEVRELDERLRQDPDARRRFFLLADQEVAVRDLAGALPARRRRRRPTAPATPVPWAWLGAAAAAAVLVIAALAAPRAPRTVPTVEPNPIVREPVREPIPERAVERPAPRPEPPREVPPEPPRIPPPRIDIPRPAVPVVTPPPPPPKEERRTVPLPEPAPSVPALAVVSADAIEGAPAPFAWTEGAALSSRRTPGHLVLENGTRLLLAADTELRLASAPTVAVQLEKGEVHCSVPSQKGLAFAVLTPAAEVRVTGTQFVVALEGETTRVHVDEGSVRVTRRSDSKVLALRAGQAVAVGPGLPFAAKLRAPNLLVDPGFEAGGRGWRGFEGRPPPLGPGLGLVPGRRGKAAIQLSPDYRGTLTQGVAVEPGAVYEFEAFAKIPGTGSWGMSVVWLDETGNWKAWVKSDDFVLLSGPRDWTRWSGRFTAPPRAKTAWVVVYASQPNAVILDDFYVGQISR